MDKCLNCGAEISTKYCPHCGQEKIIKRLEVKTIVQEVTHGLFHWDKLILSTFKLLLTRPGCFVKEYINGKRKSRIKPFTFFLFFLTIYVLLFHWMSLRYFAFYSSSLNLTGSKLSKMMRIQHLVSTHINYLYFILPLVFAFILRLFLKKRTGINYAESLVFSFYTFAMVLIFGTLIMLLSIIDVRIWNLRLVISFIYLAFAVMQFSSYTKVKGWFIGGVTVILSYTVYLIHVLILVLGYLVLFTHSM